MGASKSGDSRLVTTSWSNSFPPEPAAAARPAIADREPAFTDAALAVDRRLRRRLGSVPRQLGIGAARGLVPDEPGLSLGRLHAATVGYCTFIQSFRDRPGSTSSRSRLEWGAGGQGRALAAAEEPRVNPAQRAAGGQPGVVRGARAARRAPGPLVIPPRRLSERAWKSCLERAHAGCGIEQIKPLTSDTIRE